MSTAWLNTSAIAQLNGGTSKTTVITYAQDAGVSYRSNPRVVRSQIADGTSGRRTDLNYTLAHGVWLPYEQVEYNGDQTTVYRKTVTSYSHYPAQRLIGLPQKVAVYNAANVKLAETENVYDETGSYTDSNNQTASYFINATGLATVQHDDANYGANFTARGNITRTLQYNGGTGAGARVIKHISYDTNGNVRATADGANNRSQVLYTDNYSNKPAGIGNTEVYAYTVANPIGFRTGSQHNYYTGQALQTFNLVPGGTTPQQTVTTSYDFADRPLTTTSPDGGTVTTHYWDNWLTLGTRQLADGAYRFKWDIYDGAGRTYKKAADHPDAVAGKYSGQVTVFNNIGEVTDSSNTIAVNSSFAAAFEDASPGFLFTHMAYDTLGKLEEVTRPDNNQVLYDREGCGCAGNMTTRVSDELGVTTESKTDFLGRMKEAKEVNTSIGVGYYSRAEYIYNELDQLTTINHSDAAGSVQARTFSYDGYGRLTSETTPEAGTVSQTYTSNDQLATKTDARNITTSYTYNTRGLPTAVTYSDGTGAASYAYDDYGARYYAANNEGSSYFSYDSLRRPDAETHYFTALGYNQAYLMVYSHNQSGLSNYHMYRQDLINGSWQAVWNKRVTYAYKATGALAGVGTDLIGSDPNSTTNVLNSTSFRATGAIKQLDYGNGLRLEMGYSAERQQPTSMKVAPVSNPNAPVLHYGYNYYDASSHNNNRIRKITDHVDNNYTSEFTYDQYNRLSMAAVGSYSTNSRSYNYDAWGNLKTANSLTVNGYQPMYTINYAGNASGAPATNRIQNVVENGQTLNHSYDAAGNLTNDGQKTYSYDGAGRMTSVNAGALGTSGYNADGQRVRKVEGGATSYYVYSSVVGGAAFELSGTGTINRVHVKAGGKAIAQLATDGAFYWLHADHLGTPRKMTNGAGVVMFRGEYDPHGNPLLEWSVIGNPNLNNNKFTGYERDNAAGLDFAQARHYKYGRGRFMQSDPIGLKSVRAQKPETLNLYRYTANDPINFVDSTGTFECAAWLCGPDYSALWALMWGGHERQLEMPIDAPTYEYGGEGGGDIELPTYSDSLISDLGNLTSDCVRAFGGQDKIDKWIAKLKNGEVTFYHYTSPARNIPLPPGFTSISDYYNRSKARGRASGVTVTGGIKYNDRGEVDPNGNYTDAGVYNAIIIGRNPLRSTLLHEFLHWESRGNHLAIAGKLGLTGYDNNDDDSAADALRAFLEKCFKSNTSDD